MIRIGSCIRLLPAVMLLAGAAGLAGCGSSDRTSRTTTEQTTTTPPPVASSTTTTTTEQTRP